MGIQKKAFSTKIVSLRKLIKSYLTGAICVSSTRIIAYRDKADPETSLCARKSKKLCSKELEKD